MRASASGRPRAAEARQGSSVLWAALIVLGGLGAGIAAGTAVFRRLVRYEVVGESMEPSLRSGAWVVVDAFAYRVQGPRAGDVVLAAHPEDPGRTLVKRVAAILPDGGVELRGDNADRSTDSRHFGPVAPTMLLGRVRWRYWPRPGAVR